MKMKHIIIAITLSAFFAVNAYLIYGPKNTVPSITLTPPLEKSVGQLVTEEVEKPLTIASAETLLVQLNAEDAVERWNIQEGDHVTFGEELVTLQTSRVNGQVEQWAAEREALQEERDTVDATLGQLLIERDNASSQESNRIDQSLPEDYTQQIEVNLLVDQYGSFAVAIAEVDRELAKIDRQIRMLDYLMNETNESAAVISPIDGIVKAIHLDYTHPTIEIISNEQVLTSYVNSDEWKKIDSGSTVRVRQAAEEPEEVQVLTKAPLPVQLDEGEGYRFTTTLPVFETPRPFGEELSGSLVLNEAAHAFAVPNDQVQADDEKLRVLVLNQEGIVEWRTVLSAFQKPGQMVITEGLYDGDILVPGGVAGDRVATRYHYTKPTKSLMKQFGKRNIVKSLLLK